MPLRRLAALFLLTVIASPLFAAETFKVDGHRAVIHPAAKPARETRHGCDGYLA